MNQRIEAAKETGVGCALWIGGGMAILGVVVAYTSSTASVVRSTATRNPNTGAIGDSGPSVGIAIGVGLIVLGLALIAGAIAYGYMQVHNRNRGPVKSYPGARVVSRFATNRQGDYLTQDWQLEGEKVQRFVKLDLGPSAGVLEFECAPEAYEAAGEGMVGVARVQGRWLGSFEPSIGAQHYQTDDRMIDRLNSPDL
jgi:hypothetical protein